MAARPTEWIYEMSAADNADLNAATAAAISTGKNILDIEAVDFSLPQFGAKLAEMREEMLHGRGFKLLRGLPIQDRPIEEVAFMYWGIGVHLGYAVSQNAKGHVLGHVRIS